jgi:putative endonuclease
MPDKTPAQKIGQLAEDQACEYLISQGLQIIARNYRCSLGEIDAIVLDKTNLIFVEVRCRKSSQFGSAAETVNYHKQKKLIKTALCYMQHTSSSLPCRFDVVSVTPHLHKPPNIEWIKDAFQVEYN